MIRTRGAALFGRPARSRAQFTRLQGSTIGTPGTMALESPGADEGRRLGQASMRRAGAAARQRRRRARMPRVLETIRAMAETLRHAAPAGKGDPESGYCRYEYRETPSDPPRQASCLYPFTGMLERLDQF